MDIRGTTARLRRTFHYPTDDSSNGGTPEVLDEEEQEHLIQTLAEQNASHNAQYQMLLAALPILSSIPYLVALFRPSTFLIAVLGLTSLASTGFLLFSLPPTETGVAVLDSWARSAGGPNPGQVNEDRLAAASGSGSGSGVSGLGALHQRRRERRNSTFSFTGRRSPLERHLPYLNIGLCVMLILYGLLVPRGGEPGHQFGLLGLGNLPAIVYAVVIAAKVVMASVDPERELTALKYDYKGA